MKNKVSDTGSETEEQAFSFQQKKKLRARLHFLLDGAETGESSTDPDEDENGSDDEFFPDARPLSDGIKKDLHEKSFSIKDIFDIDRILARRAGAGRPSVSDSPSRAGSNLHLPLPEQKTKARAGDTGSDPLTSSPATKPSILRKQPWPQGKDKKSVVFNDMVSLFDDKDRKSKSRISAHDEHDKRDRIIALTRLITLKKKQAGYVQSEAPANIFQKMRGWAKNVQYAGTGHVWDRRPNDALLALRELKAGRETLEVDYRNSMLVGMMRQIDFLIEAQKNALDNAGSALQALKRGEPLDEVRSRSISILRKFAEVEVEIDRQLMSDWLALHDVEEFFSNLAEKAEQESETEDAGLARAYALTANQLKQLPLVPGFEASVKARFDADAVKLAEEVVQQLQDGFDKMTERWEQIATYVSQMDALPARHDIGASAFLIRMLTQFSASLAMHERMVSPAFSAYREEVLKEAQWKAELPLYLKQAEIEKLRNKIDSLAQFSRDIQGARSVFSDVNIPAETDKAPFPALSAVAPPFVAADQSFPPREAVPPPANPSDRHRAQTALVGAGTVALFFGGTGLSLYAVGIGAYTLAIRLADYFSPAEPAKQGYEERSGTASSVGTKPEDAVHVPTEAVSTESSSHLNPASRVAENQTASTENENNQFAQMLHSDSPDLGQWLQEEMPPGDQAADEHSEQSSQQSDNAHSGNGPVRNGTKPYKPYAGTGRTMLVTTNHILLSGPGDVLLIDEMPGFGTVIVDSSSLADGDDLQGIEILPLLAEGDYTIDIGPVVYRANARMERSFKVSAPGEADVTFLLRGDEPTVARQISWIRMVARYASSLGTEKRTQVYGILRGHSGARAPQNISESTILLNSAGHVLTFYFKPDFRKLTVNLANLSGSSWQRRDSRKVILFELLIAGFYVESFSNIVRDGQIYGRTATLYSKKHGYFLLEVRGARADVDRIISDMESENKKYGTRAEDNEKDEKKPDHDGLVSGSGRSDKQAELINDRLAAVSLTSATTTIVRTAPADEFDIRIPAYPSSPDGKIELHIYQNTVNFPDDARGRFEIIFKKQDKSGRFPKINLPRSEVLKLVSKQTSEDGTGSVSYANDQPGENFFLITVTNNDANNQEALLFIDNRIREDNEARFKTYMSYTGPFMEEEFRPNPSVNGSYAIDSSERPVTFYSDDANDTFELVTIEHDVTVVVGAYAPRQPVTPFSPQRPDRQWIVRSSKKPLMFHGPWLREDAAADGRAAVNYTRRFTARDNGANLVISGRDSSSNEAVDDLAEKIKSSMKAKEEEFQTWMIRLSIGIDAFANPQAVMDFNYMVIALPVWAYSRAILFYQDKAGGRSRFNEWDSTHGVRHIRFDIVRSALVLLHDAGSPGWAGAVDWESTPIPKPSADNQDDLYRSKYVRRRNDEPVPLDWNWSARPWENISIGESSVEFAIENWMKQVDERASARIFISRYFEYLAGEIKDNYPEDARKILYLLSLLNTGFPEGADVPLALDRSKRIFTEFDKAMKLGRLEQTPVREKLLKSLRDLLPKFDVPGPVNSGNQPVQNTPSVSQFPPEVATEDAVTAEAGRYEPGDPAFGRLAAGGRFGFNEVASTLTIPAWWALETLAGEINAPVDSTSYAISAEDYAGVVIVKPPLKDAAFLFPEWEGENPDSYRIFDISLLLLAGTDIELIDDAKSKLGKSGVEDKERLQGKTLGAIRLNGKSSKILIFFAGDAALVGLIKKEIKEQFTEFRQWEQASNALAWEAPTLGVMPGSLAEENSDLFKQIGVKDKPDNDFTLSGISDLVGDKLQLTLAEMWKKETRDALEFLLAIPDISAVAKAAMEKSLLQRLDARAKADETYIVFFNRYIYTKAEADAPYSISEGQRRQADGDNYYERSEVYTAIRLDKLAIENFPAGDNGIAETLHRLTHFSLLDPYFYAGIYTWKGSGLPAIFSSENRLKNSAGGRVRFVDFYRGFKTIDVQKQAVDAVENFFSADRKAEHAARLKEMYALRLLREAANMDTATYDLASAVLDPESKDDQTLHIETVDVYAYDILDAFIVYREPHRTVILYMLPQKDFRRPAFLVFENMQAFKEYMHSLTIQTPARNDLLARIKAEDRADDKDFFSRDGFYARRGADYLLEVMPGPIRRHHVSDRHTDWTYQTQIVRSTLDEVNQKSARSRNINSDPFAKMADMFQRYIRSAVKISMFSHEEYEADVRTRVVSDVSLYLGIMGLILFKVMPPWLGDAIGFSTAAPGLGVGIRQYLEHDRSSDRLKGIELAIGSGLDLMLGGLPMARHRDEKNLVVSRQNFDDFVLRHGEGRVGTLMKAIHVDPDLARPQGLHAITSDPAEHLLDIPAALNQAARRGDRVVEDMVKELRARFRLINESGELDSAGKHAKMLTVLKAQNKEVQDKLYEMFIRIDLPEDAIGDADDLISKLLNQARDEEESSLMAFAKQQSNPDKLKEAQTLAQQHVQALSDELTHPELFVGDRKEYLKKISDKDISPADAISKDTDDVYTINGQLYVFIDDMAVRINTVQHVLGTTVALLPPFSSGAFTIQRINGRWRLAEPKLLGGAPPMHDIGLGSSQLSSLHANSKNYYRLRLPDTSRPVDVVFDLTTCRWAEAGTLGDITPGGREFIFSPATDSSSEIWREYSPAAGRLPPATTRMRADALEQFGFAREVPSVPAYPVPRFYDSKELPKVIHKIWIGANPVSTENISKLRRTLVQAKNSQFELKLHLDISNPVAHDNTMKLLKPLIDDGLKVVELRSEKFFKRFQKEKYFEQFEFYLESENLNYAGATNILRYRMIYHDGGFYSDMDDVLKGPLKVNQIKHRDVVVYPPFEGLNYEYNNSFFGSAAKNPTLGKLSEESYRKFQENRNHMRQRPYFDPAKDKDHQSAAFYRYMNIRSQTDGPALFSRVISENIPARKNFKQWKSILGGKGVVLSGDQESRYLEASEEFEALDEVYEVGADHTSL